MTDLRHRVSKDLIADFSNGSLAKSSWVRQFRGDSKNRFLEMGAPLQSDEEWRFSDPKLFTNANYEKNNHKAEKIISPFDELDRIILVFIDGVFSKEDSDFREIDSLSLIALDDAGDIENDWAKKVFGKIEEESQKISKRPLAVFNSAFFQSGYLIRVKDDIKIPVEFRYVSKNNKSKAIVRNVIKVDSGKSMTYVEHFEGGGWLNVLSELYMESNSTVTHFKYKCLKEKGTSNTFLMAELNSKSKLLSNSLSTGAGNSRNECHVMLNGEFASVSLSAASILGDGGSLDEDVTTVHHLKPNCKSRQIFRKAQKSQSIGIFQGKIRVEKEAQKTDGYQESRAIILDESSKFFAKPELEIFADDVSCSHGSVSGPIDLSSLFYLRSRGISEDKAKSMLIFAFLNEVFDEIEDDDIREKIKSYVEKKLDI